MFLRAAALRRAGIPRGLVIEPTTVCGAGCRGCVPSPEAVLAPGRLREWLGCAPVVPATFSLVGRHSDPLCSPHLPEMAEIAASSGLLVSISTVGLGLEPAHLRMPVDRWIVSIPGATPGSYAAVRGNDRLAEVLEATERIGLAGRGMLEVVLTLWRPSEGDAGAFRELARARGWKSTQVVQGLFDPTGFDVGRPGMLATSIPGALYSVEGGEVRRTAPEGACPALGYLLIDASGAMAPCPFACDPPRWTEPSARSWREASAFESTKRTRPFPECRWCP